jgi:Zn-dependent peptidase ImmA (M78 family)
MILHQEICKDVKFSTPEEVVEFQVNMTDQDYGWYQYQANVFAACVLVPTEILIKEYEIAVKDKEKVNKEAEFILPYLMLLPDKFEVSTDVLIQRIKKEKLIKN